MADATATTYPKQGFNPEHDCILLIFEPTDVLIALGLPETEPNLAKARDVLREHGERITDGLLDGWSDQMSDVLRGLEVEEKQFPDNDPEV